MNNLIIYESIELEINEMIKLFNTKSKKLTLTQSIKLRVNIALGGFKNNMNRYYQSTGSSKRVL